MSHLPLALRSTKLPQQFGENNKIADLPYASSSSVAKGPWTIGQKLSQELKINHQIRLTPKESKGPETCSKSQTKS